jgi:hypothetical protein
VSTRLPLVLADDGLISQLQGGDSLPESRAAAQLLVQNNAIIRLLAGLAIALDAAPIALSDDDVERFISETRP